MSLDSIKDNNRPLGVEGLNGEEEFRGSNDAMGGVLDKLHL